MHLPSPEEQDRRCRVFRLWQGGFRASSTGGGIRATPQPAGTAPPVQLGGFQIETIR